MNGQTVNVAGVSRDAGVARQTVQGYNQILDDTLIGWWIPAWQRKRCIRQVAHPKFYLFDCGVARHLAGLGHPPVHPEERGFLFETLGVIQGSRELPVEGVRGLPWRKFLELLWAGEIIPR